MKKVAETTVDTLKEILDAFNRHDVDGIMSFFADDCRFDMYIRKDSYWKISE